MNSHRRLIVMRHAKAEPFAATDQGRVLTARGVRSAREAGRHLAAAGITPDYVIVSTAVRSSSTWEAVAEAAGLALAAVVDTAVYHGSADVVLEALRAAPADASTVMFVGHNPSAAYLATQIDDGDGDARAIHEMLHGFPVGALVVFDVEVPWADLGPETGRVVDFHVPR
ncbi:MAG: histidine phosphatase family protein [Actinomycetota bacterium]|nr:histidine phosphatase family protein [Actinomycetota bacterium]